MEENQDKIEEMQKEAKRLIMDEIIRCETTGYKFFLDDMYWTLDVMKQTFDLPSNFDVTSFGYECESELFDEMEGVKLHYSNPYQGYYARLSIEENNPCKLIKHG